MAAPTLSYLADVYFRPGAIADLPEVMARLKVERPIIVTDPGVCSTGLVQRVAPLLPGAVVFSEVESNPTERSALAGLSMYRESECDGVLALGGGSPMDCAKAIALLSTHPAPLEAYAFIRGGLSKITAHKPPVVCVPTTAGTGSEVGRAALITLASGEKLAILSPHLIPNAALCDPELTLGLPPHLTAATGMDALSHCVEALCSPRYNPVADAIAIDGLARAVSNIRPAVECGQDLDARREMMMAALQGGMTFQKGLGAVHALSHPLGALPRQLHHGTLNALLLPHVLRFNAEYCKPAMQRMAAALSLPGGAALIDLFHRLPRTLGLPTTLREMGVMESDLERVPEQATADHCSATNPRPASREDYRELLKAAF